MDRVHRPVRRATARASRTNGERAHLVRRGRGRRSRGRPAGARPPAVAPRPGSEGLERLPVNEFWLFAVSLAAFAADAAQDREKAAVLHDALVPHRRFLVGNVAPIIGPLGHAAGRAALAAGRNGEAYVLLHEARCRVEELDCPPWIVECLRDEARALEASGRSGSELRGRSQALARQLGMADTDPSGGTDGPRQRLSRREREVLDMLAQGRTNQEIARDLYISYRTAKTHVSNILTKLGARDRNEAAAIARRNQISA